MEKSREMENYYRKFGELLSELKKDYPKFVEAFTEFFEAAESEGTLDLHLAGGSIHGLRC